MEQLQINHIAPYLPYGLKCQLNRLGVFNLDEEYPIPHNDICEITNLVKVGNDWDIEISGSGDCSFGMIGLDEIEIFLRPMSSLYKEIDGEVGIVEIFRMFGIYHENIRVTNCGLKYNDGAEWLLFDWSYSAQSFIDSDGGIYLNMESLTYLFQHHYDVFGLIDKGLAIDINTLK